MANVAYEYWKMNRKKSLTFTGKQRPSQYVNQSNMSTNSTAEVKSILKLPSTYNNRESEFGSVHSRMTPLEPRDSLDQWQVNPLDQRANSESITNFNRCVIKFNAKKSSKSKQKFVHPKQKFKAFYSNTKYGNDEDKPKSTEREKRLMDYMDHSKFYMNSLKEYLRSSRQHKVSNLF